MDGHPTDRVPRGSLPCRCAAVVGTALLAGALVAAPGAVASMTRVGLWHMDELPGAKQMLDASGFGNHGKLGNVETGQSGANAFSGRAYRFSGSKRSYAEVPSSPSLVPGSSSYMFEVHAKFTKANPPTGSYDLVRKGVATTSGGDLKMEIRSGGKARCHWETSKGSADVRSGGNLADGRWHRIACLKTPTEIQLHVDGKTYRKSKQIGPLTNKAAITIGAKSSSEDLFNGSLDEVSVWIDR